MRDIQARKHLSIPESATHSCAPAPTIDGPIAMADRAIAAICDLNDQFLPSHTREHALAALDLLRVVREELTVPDVDEAPCRLRVVL
jgi:hypothetical protein